MTKRPFELLPDETFAHAGMRYTVTAPVLNLGEKTTVFTNVMVLHIPNVVSLKMR